MTSGRAGALAFLVLIFLESTFSWTPRQQPRAMPQSSGRHSTPVDRHPTARGVFPMDKDGNYKLADFGNQKKIKEEDEDETGETKSPGYLDGLSPSAAASSPAAISSGDSGGSSASPTSSSSPFLPPSMRFPIDNDGHYRLADVPNQQKRKEGVKDAASSGIKSSGYLDGLSTPKPSRRAATSAGGGIGSTEEENEDSHSSTSSSLSLSSGVAGGDNAKHNYKLMWNKLEYARHREVQSRKRYQIIAAEAWEGMAEQLEGAYPERFHFHKTTWGKFPDGTDNIEVGGYTPYNVIAGERVLFLASFHNNDVTLSQFQVLVMLLQSFIKELVVVLPFYPVGTMERTVKEGQVATANTYAQMFSNLPSCGRPTRLIIYDLHTLQNRFYLHGNVIGSLKTTVPLLFPALERAGVDCIAFPDDGAAKRFAHMFEAYAEERGARGRRSRGGAGADAVKPLEIVTCGKVRDGDERFVTIQDGDPEGRVVVIVDDLVQSGGTLYECALALRKRGARAVNAFVAHGVFPRNAWTRFATGGDRAVFDTFWVTNSIPTTTKMLDDDVFEVIDLMPQIVQDLDNY